MSRKIHFIIIGLLVSITVCNYACTQKAVPVITSRTTEPLKKAKPTLSIKSDLVLGKAIFENRCTKCHDLPKPEQFTKERWEGILSYMMPRARLNEEQSEHVSAYLKENAAK